MTAVGPTTSARRLNTWARPPARQIAPRKTAITWLASRAFASGVLAVTCYWIRGGKIVEADMRITTRESWALSLANCHGDMPLLESTITHEAGHVFGLDHVGERKHGRLTMSPFLDGPCNDNEATLGLGDMLGLEATLLISKAANFDQSTLQTAGGRARS